MARTRSDVISYHEAQIDFLLKGAPAVQELFESGTASRTTLRRAVDDLTKRAVTDEQRERARAFERWYVENVGQLGKGHTQPEDGDCRSYKVQQLEGERESGPFIRLPVPLAKKGDSIFTRYSGALIEVHQLSPG